VDSPLNQELSAHSATTSQPGETVPAGEPSREPAPVKPPLPASAKAAPRAVGAVVESTPDPPVNKMRRRIVWASVVGFLTTCFLMFLRFFLPRSILEPSSKFSVGFPSDYALGVDTKWQQQYRIWVDKTSDRVFVIYARCTHLGCTPDWKASENKFKCPCHGSGYDSEGINFEGPAPRPMDRAHVDLDAEGQIVVDIGKLYRWPKGEKNEFNDPGAYIPL
jgi:cytochrome b6-f complex iron-sulfur subunit